MICCYSFCFSSFVFECWFCVHFTHVRLFCQLHFDVIAAIEWFFYFSPLFIHLYCCCYLGFTCFRNNEFNVQRVQKKKISRNKNAINSKRKKKEKNKATCKIYGFLARQPFNISTIVWHLHRLIDMESDRKYNHKLNWIWYMEKKKKKEKDLNAVCVSVGNAFFFFSFSLLHILCVRFDIICIIEIHIRLFGRFYLSMLDLERTLYKKSCHTQ